MDEKILKALRHELLNGTNLHNLPENVWKVAGALNTYGTNAIEGNTLTQAEVETVLLKGLGVRNRSLQDISETQNHAKAFKGLLERLGRPIDLVTMQELHEGSDEKVLMAGEKLIVCYPFCYQTSYADQHDNWSNEMINERFEGNTGLLLFLTFHASYLPIGGRQSRWKVY